MAENVQETKPPEPPEPPPKPPEVPKPTEQPGRSEGESPGRAHESQQAAQQDTRRWKAQAMMLAGPHPNWDIAVSLLASVLPGSTDYAPDKITGHTRDDWQPFDVEDRDMDEVEDDLLDRCSEMTGPLIVVNDTSYASYTFKRGPYFVEASKLREFAKTFGDRVGSYFMDGHVIIVSPVTGIVVMVMDDGLIATVRGRPVMQTFP